MSRRASADAINGLREKLKKEIGDFCHIGKKCKDVNGKELREKGKDLEVHHIDSNPSNDSTYNLTLACGPCNKALSKRGKLKIHRGIPRLRIRARERESMEASREAGRHLDLIKNGLTFTQRKNIEGEWKFVKWLQDKVTRHGYWSLEDSINAGALVADVSIQTTERWIKKLLSSEGRYGTHTREGVVILIFKGKIPRENITGPSQSNESGFDSSAETR